MRGLTLAIACLALTTIAFAEAEKKIVCYFGSWAVYRPGNGKFDISYIDPHLCTHLIYTFVGISGNNVRVLDAWQDLPDNWGKNGFGRFNALREQNPSVKTIIAIGGWNEGSSKYSAMASSAASREEFAQNVVKFVKKWNFDGFDLDWEYPAQRGGAQSDVDNYIELLKVMRSHFDKEGLILSAAVAAAESSASKSYRIREMSKYLDFINLMAYDLHGAWESTTGINAPLFPAASETGAVRGLNVEASVNYWLSQGAPKDKLILGVPSYGRAFTLSDPKSNGIGASTRGAGKAGPYTREPGMLGYNEICQSHLKGGWSVYYDEERRVPYAHKGDQWVGFDNIKSIKEKAEYAKKLDLGGAMVWSIETDDFKGICGEKYPILKTLKAVLRGGAPVAEEPELSVAPPEVSPTPQDPPAQTVAPSSAPSEPKAESTEPSASSEASEFCNKSGIVAKPNSCDFILCSPRGNGKYSGQSQSCPPGTCFNAALGICDWKKV